MSTSQEQGPAVQPDPGESISAFIAAHDTMVEGVLTAMKTPSSEAIRQTTLQVNDAVRKAKVLRDSMFFKDDENILASVASIDNLQDAIESLIETAGELAPNIEIGEDWSPADPEDVATRLLTVSDEEAQRISARLSHQYFRMVDQWEKLFLYSPAISNFRLSEHDAKDAKRSKLELLAISSPLFLGGLVVSQALLRRRD